MSHTLPTADQLRHEWATDPRWSGIARPYSAEDVVRPAMPDECTLDRLALTMGYAGVYSSFLKHATTLAQRYGVSGAEMLVRAGARRLVGGQEDQLIDIAVQLAAER